ncbi:unnamed protein product [Penicillium olsonii]|nr:unnamed protein product [Penicillium olsonii]
MLRQIATCSEGIGVAGPNPSLGNEKFITPIADLEEVKEEITVTNSVLIDDYDPGTRDTIIVTGADVAAHLMPMRDDHDTAITFRAIFLGSVFVAFSAGLGQIYNFKPGGSSLASSLILIFVYVLGTAWANVLPDANKFENRWRARRGQGKTPKWISALRFLNPGPFGIKEHAAIMICSSATTDDADFTALFAAQKLFYDVPLTATSIVLTLISVGLFGYGVCGLIRPVAVWHLEAVYWTNIPSVKTLQDLHWGSYRDSRQLRFFWYAFGGMAIYQIIPGWMFPWLNGVSIPCLASQKATGYNGSVLTNLFGGATANEGLGFFSLCFDWQYLGMGTLALPLKLQLHSTVGLGICCLVMIAIYYGNVWDALSQPFMSPILRTDSGKPYPSKSLFPSGRLDISMLEKYGIPRLSGTFAYGLLMANAAASTHPNTLRIVLWLIPVGQIGALFVHIALLWGEEVWRSFHISTTGQFKDPHHAHMAEHYKRTPWWWYVIILVFSFVLGLVVVIKENLMLPPWAYVVALILGIIVSFFVGIGD